MIYQVVAVKDRAADAYAAPMFIAANGAAIRAFSSEVNRADNTNMLYCHPDDFDLYSLGTYDDSNAKFEMHSEVQLIARGKDMAIREKQ